MIHTPAGHRALLEEARDSLEDCATFLDQRLHHEWANRLTGISRRLDNLARAAELESQAQPVAPYAFHDKASDKLCFANEHAAELLKDHEDVVLLYTAPTQAQPVAEPFAWADKGRDVMLHHHRQHALEQRVLGPEFEALANVAEEYDTPLYTHAPVVTPDIAQAKLVRCACGEPMVCPECTAKLGTPAQAQPPAAGLQREEICSGCGKPIVDCDCEQCNQCGASGSWRTTECGLVCIECGQLKTMKAT